jgi:hypothetical protein
MGYISNLSLISYNDSFEFVIENSLAENDLMNLNKVFTDIHKIIKSNNGFLLQSKIKNNFLSVVLTVLENT